MTLQPWQFETFDAAFKYALDWQTVGQIRQSIIKVDGIYEVISTDTLSEDKNVIAEFSVILYADYMNSSPATIRKFLI